MSTAVAIPVDQAGNDLAGAPSRLAHVCDYPGRVVPLANLQTLAHDEIRKKVSAPTIASAPPGKTLVNLPTIFAASTQPEPSIQITNPVPGRIFAVPTYAWDYGDGAKGVGPGLAYQAGDVPSELPGKYLTHTYTTQGPKTVTLTVTWRVTFQLEGITDIPLAPIVFTATDVKDVATARAVLTG